MFFPIYIYIAILLVVALLSTRLMKLIKLPNVTGFIITGIIMGPFVFGVLFNNFTYEGIKEGIIYKYINQIGWVSNIALGFIAFSIGTSFHKSSLQSVGKRILVITILEALGGSVIVIAALLVTHFIIPDIVTWPIVLTLGAIASATAPAATLMIIKQYNAKGKLVDTLLPVVALDDAVALILFAILFQLAKGLAHVGSEISYYDMLAKPLIEIVMSLGFGAVIGFIISFANKLFKSRNNRLILCIITVFLAVGLCELFKITQLGQFSLSALLICMMSGAIYTNMAKDSGKTLDLLDRFTGPIYMMFFVISGASLDLSIFFNSQGLLILVVSIVYIIFRVAGKYLGAFTGAAITKSEPQVRKYLGLTLIPQAGVAIGLATTANAELSTNPETSSLGALLLAVVLTSTLIYELVGPVISKFALTKAGDINTVEQK